MRYARDDRARKDVDAHEIGERGRSRAYSCPSCGARVHYKSSIGLSPYPIFAHNAHEGSPDCENYYPWQGGYDVPSSPSPAVIRPRPAVEDTPDELGLCLEDGATWNTYLRLPELSTADLGGVSLGRLAGAFVEAEAGGERNRLPLIELKPGVGSARLVIPPVTTAYKISTAGSWPPQIRQRRWQTTSRGLNPRGTLFRLRHGEWVRLREGTPVEFGEELRVVADQRNAPPAQCSPVAGKTISFRAQTWRMWRVEIPAVSTRQFEVWAESLGVNAVDPAWDVRFASIPEEVIPEGQVPVFSSRRTLIAKLSSPHTGARADVSLATGSARYSESFSTAPGDDTAFVAFAVPWPGSNELTVAYDDRTAVRFETRDPRSLVDVRRALARVPLLRVTVGESVVKPWQEPFEILLASRSEEAPRISLLPDLEDFRVSLHWQGPDGEGSEEGLTREIAVRRLNAFFELRRGTEVRLDGGALGSVKLHFRAPAKKKLATGVAVKRRLRWLSAALEQSESGKAAPLPAWALRRAASLDSRLLSAASKSSDPKWTALVLRAVRGAKS